MSGATNPPCIVVMFADEAALHTLRQAARDFMLSIYTSPPSSSSTFLALIDATLPDSEAHASRLAALEGCRGVLFLGAAPQKDFMVPVRIIPRPIRLSALLAFCEKTWQALHQPIRVLAPGLLFDPRGRFLLCEADATRADLTAKESEMLEMLLAAGDEGVERERLLREIWHYGANLETHTLETHIYRLRQKLEKMQSPLTLRMDQGRCKLSA